MKRLLALLAFVSSFLFCAQDISLSDFFKIEGFIDKIGIGYETPINEKLLLNLNLGVGGADIVRPGEIGYRLGKQDELVYTGVFLKGQLRYYINREKRGSKNLSLLNNVGSFIGVQSKFNTNRAHIGKVISVDAHFGQQLPLPLNNRFIFYYHLGLGHSTNLDLNYGDFYPALVLSFAYVIR